jgi:hypothetical protein
MAFSDGVGTESKRTLESSEQDMATHTLPINGRRRIMEKEELSSKILDQHGSQLRAS